jgi:FdhD protein
VVGFLYTSGFMEKASSITSLTIDQDRWKAYVDCAVTFPSEVLFKRIYTSGCGKGIIFHNPLDVMQRVRLADGFTLAGEQFFGMMKKFITSSEEFRLTGGVHSAALIGDAGTIFKDDLGRHNALDKAIGEGLQKKIDFSAQVALTSGRVSSEIVAKILRCQIPVLASSGAPTNQAVKIAREANMTLLGFVRGQRLNIYSGEQRIV